MSRLRPRFSLLTMLLLMTIVGMAIVIVQLWREVSPLRDEVGRLRQELGYLTVHDENKLYAIEVPVSDPNMRRFRVFLPKNEAFRIHTRLHTIPGRTPQVTREKWLASLLQSRSGTSSMIDSGEHTIDVQLRRDPEKESHWDLAHSISGKGAGRVGTVMPWLNDRRAWSISSEAHIGEQIERKPADGIVLFALRQGIVKETDGGYSMSSPDESAKNPGIMLWIVPTSADE